MVPGAVKNGSDCFNGYRVSFKGNEDVPELDSGAWLHSPVNIPKIQLQTLKGDSYAWKLTFNEAALKKDKRDDQEIK